MIETILAIAFPLFLLMDPIGNIPIYLAVLKDCKPGRQRKIILRELIIALLIIIAFCIIGNYILGILNVQQYTVMIAGGIILFLIALQMIFPPSSEKQIQRNADPLVVPLAVPLVAGPAVLAAVMLYSHQTENKIIVICGIVLAWIGTAAILISSSFLQRVLKDRGILALERLMGLILTLIAVQMFMHGITFYQKSL